MAERQEYPGAKERREPAYERRDIGGGVLVAAVVVLLLAVALVHVLTTVLFVVFTGEQPVILGPTPAPQVTPPIPPEPRLQVAPADEFRRLQATQEAILGNYGWVDQEAGVVRIPIDQAMDLLLERGLPLQAESPEAKENP